MDLNDFRKNILNDVKVELKGEFDRNFERKAFFDQAWPKNKLVNRKGSQMARTNNLRRSIKAEIKNAAPAGGQGQIVFSSSLPYAKIQNEGGEITVTHKMKKFFWHMFYETSGQIKARKDGTARKTKANLNLSIEAEQWRNLALMKVGSKIKIDPKKFIGDHPQVRKSIEDVVNDNLKDITKIIENQFKTGK